MQLILHIGQQKTGSSSLQKYLFDNYQNLLENGILYPKTFLLGHKHGQLQKQTSDISQYEQNFVQELTPNLNTVIISDENLFYCTDQKLYQLSHFFTKYFNKIILVAYLRRQDFHVTRLYQESVKGYYPYDFEHFLYNFRIPAFRDTPLIKLYYNYFNALERWKGVLPIDSQIKAISYKHINIIKSFNRIINYTISLPNKNEIVNRSINQKSIEFSQILNGLIEKNNEKPKNLLKSLINHYFVSRGPRNSVRDISKSQAQYIYDHTYESNVRLSENYFEIEEEKGFFTHNYVHDYEEDQTNKEISVIDSVQIFYDFFKYLEETNRIK